MSLRRSAPDHRLLVAAHGQKAALLAEHLTTGAAVSFPVHVLDAAIGRADLVVAGAGWLLRDGEPYRAGPSLRIADGRLRAAGRDLAAAPVDTWFRVTVECGLGVSADGLFSVRLEAPGRDPLVFENLPLASPEFRSLRWFGFVAMADAPARFYLDNLSASVR